MNRALALVLALPLLASRSVSATPRPSFDDLLANLKSPNAKTRQEAAAALGKSHRRQAVGPLAALVRDPEAGVRLEVARALGELRDLSAIPALVTSMGDGDPKIREEAIGAIVGTYAERNRTTPVDRFLEIFSDEYDRASVPPYAEVDETVFKSLGKALRDDEKGIRAEAAFAVGILGGASASKELVGALQDVDAGVRGAAATAIGKVGTVQDGKALIGLLGDESAGVRNRVLQALGVLKVRDAGPALRQMFEANRRRELGQKALATLSRIGDPNQADLFRELVQDADPERKRLAVEGLARVSDTSMLAAFKKDYQRERGDELKLAYAFALTMLGDRAFLDSLVLNLPSRILGTRCRSYILEMGRDILPDLYSYLNDPDADIRAELCDILAVIGDPETIARLTPLINDPSPRVADRANHAVERLKRAPAPEAR